MFGDICKVGQPQGWHITVRYTQANCKICSVQLMEEIKPTEGNALCVLSQRQHKQRCIDQKGGVHSPPRRAHNGTRIVFTQ